MRAGVHTAPHCPATDTNKRHLSIRMASRSNQWQSRKLFKLQNHFSKPFLLASISSLHPLRLPPMHPKAAGELPPATAMELEVGFYDSNCSTPYVSAPSSPGRGTPAAGFFFSAPASPMHYVLSSSASSSEYVSSSAEFSADFEFSARLGSSSSAAAGGSMISADELFLNGQIRPMRLSSHLQRPQKLTPLLDLEVEVEEEEDFTGGGGGEGSCEKSGQTLTRGREDLRSKSKSLRRRTRSMSPLQNWRNGRGGRDRCLIGSEKAAAAAEEEELPSEATTPSVSASSSRSNSTSSRSSKRWVFLMDFLHRSKSEGSGRSGKDKILSTISFSSIHKEKEKKPFSITTPSSPKPPPPAKKPGKPAGKRPVPPSPHELFYTANRAQAEEMRKKTYLPYRQGLLGCLGFSSKSYGAMNGLARALNPVSSR